MRRCQNANIFMESNGVETYLYGWGMSIASQRAKEHKNRTPDVKVTGKTVKREKSEMTAGGHPGVWPDVRDLMSRTLRENALQEPVVAGAPVVR